MYQIVIPGKFESLNTYLSKSKETYKTKSGKVWNAGNAMKKADQKRILQYLPDIAIKKPIIIYYEYYEPNMRRDHDNVSGYFHKIFQDALVKKGIIPDDGWRWVKGYSDRFYCNRKDPHIVVNIEEV